MVLTDKLIGIEVKKQGGKVSPNQLIMQRRFKLLGHEYHIVYSLEDVKKLGL